MLEVTNMIAYFIHPPPPQKKPLPLTTAAIFYKHPCNFISFFILIFNTPDSTLIQLT